MMESAMQFKTSDIVECDRSWNDKWSCHVISETIKGVKKERDIDGEFNYLGCGEDCYVRASINTIQLLPSHDSDNLSCDLNGKHDGKTFLACHG